MILRAVFQVLWENIWKDTMGENRLSLRQAPLVEYMNPIVHLNISLLLAWAWIARGGRGLVKFLLVTVLR